MTAFTGLLALGLENQALFVQVTKQTAGLLLLDSYYLLKHSPNNKDILPEKGNVRIIFFYFSGVLK